MLPYSTHVIMPIRGRMNQSIDTMKRLQQTAEYSAHYYAVSGMEDMEVTLKVAESSSSKPLVSSSPKLTYWYALHEATKNLPDDALVVNVANDVLPCVQWLRRAVDAYTERGDILIGFNGDGYIHHACHFLISMKYLRSLGGWPIWYHHNFGDTELCIRSIMNNRFFKHPWAVLFHNHPIVSGAKTDTVYTEGSVTYQQDQAMYERRRNAQWTF